uniref:Peptidase S16, lon-like protein n=1 Tax=Magnetococcus massalia (strain MO-1) TaxID=451514 RepID=A0A1S7LHX8_MAGMO|nr:Peptidase S16, lon-like protein [Candidatus Magnetococcus massalia]
MEIPLFPLHAELQPGDHLELRIFEPRYLQMIKRVAGKKEGFGIVQIVAGSDAGPTPVIVDHGILATLVDFEARPDGLLGIKVLGERTFKIDKTWVLDDGLMMGEVTLHDDLPPAQGS